MRSANADEQARDIPFYQHVERVCSGQGVAYMNGVAPSRLMSEISR